MSVLDPIYVREPNELSVPSGNPALNTPFMEGAGEVAADWFFFPFSLPQILQRKPSPVEQSVATGSVVTNDSPGFLDSFARETGGIYKDTTDSAKSIASGLSSVVSSLLPWWLWAIIGIGALAWLVTVAAPYLRKSP